MPRGHYRRGSYNRTLPSISTLPPRGSNAGARAMRMQGWGGVVKAWPASAPKRKNPLHPDPAQPCGIGRVRLSVKPQLWATPGLCLDTQAPKRRVSASHGRTLLGPTALLQNLGPWGLRQPLSRPPAQAAEAAVQPQSPCGAQPGTCFCKRCQGDKPWGLMFLCLR